MFFSALPLMFRVGLFVVAIAALIGGYAIWHHKVYQAGYDAAIADVARADQAAVDRVNAGANEIKSCRDSGREWDVTTGTCR